MPETVTVLLFAQARETVGRSRLAFPLDGRPTTVTAILNELRQEYPQIGPVLAVSRVVLNGAYVRQLNSTVRPGDELAIHPPYSGG